MGREQRLGRALTVQTAIADALVFTLERCRFQQVCFLFDLHDKISLVHFRIVYMFIITVGEIILVAFV